MDAIPADLPAARFVPSGLSCPACPGVLSVGLRGTRQLELRCRVGHVFSPIEVVALKEDRLEGHLWAVVEAAEELAALLREGHGEAVRAADRERRVGSLARLAQAVRARIAENEPVAIQGEAEDGPDASGGCT